MHRYGYSILRLIFTAIHHQYLIVKRGGCSVEAPTCSASSCSAPCPSSCGRSSLPTSFSSWSTSQSGCASRSSTNGWGPTSSSTACVTGTSSSTGRRRRTAAAAASKPPPSIPPSALLPLAASRRAASRGDGRGCAAACTEVASTACRERSRRPTGRGRRRRRSRGRRAAPTACSRCTATCQTPPARLAPPPGTAIRVTAVGVWQSSVWFRWTGRGTNSETGWRSTASTSSRERRCNSAEMSGSRTTPRS